MSHFIFKSYRFDKPECAAYFDYAFQDGRSFTEKIFFECGTDYDETALDRALFLASVIIGTSYYKTFPSVDVSLDIPIDEWQANFFNAIYQEGLSQFAYENELTREDLAHFKPTDQASEATDSFRGFGVLALQSGGKDSLLTASLLLENGMDFTPYYVSNSGKYPSVLDKLGSKPIVNIRSIDSEALKKASVDGAKNGHVPVTYIIQSLAVIQAILLNKSDILVSIAHEGEEPYGYIGDLAVAHQWSKTWAAERAFSDYVARYISPKIRIGSPLRLYSELRIAQLFAERSWGDFGHNFSSCNIANYRQGNDNTDLRWCGECPKCANSYLLFAPFLAAEELKAIFDGQDLFEKPNLTNTFKGLLGIDGISKLFECVGETDELRLAYRLSQSKGGYGVLPFDVLESKFDYQKTYPAQEWAVKMIQ